MKLDGVKKADVDWKKGEVVVEYDPGKVTTSQMTKAVNESGVYKVKATEDLPGNRGSRNGGDKKQHSK